MKKQFFENIFDVAVILLVMIGTLTSAITGYKILRTAKELNEISTEISYIEQAVALSKPGYGWNDENSDRVKELQQQRQNLYSSDNNIVKWFALSNDFVQLISILIAVIAFAALIVIWILVPLRAIAVHFLRRSKKQKKPIK